MSVLLEGAGVFFWSCLANVVVRSFWNISHKSEVQGPFFRAPAVALTSIPITPGDLAAIPDAVREARIFHGKR